MVKIFAATIIRNAELIVTKMLQSLTWVDGIIIMDDHSTDKTRVVIEKYKKNNFQKIELIPPLFGYPMFTYKNGEQRNISQEMKIRNAYLQYIFRHYVFDALVLIDADELMSKNLKTVIEFVVKQKKYESIALSCYHLFSAKEYIRIYPATWNGVKLIDPHIRVITKPLKYQHGEYPGVPDCFLKPTAKTFCDKCLCHFHLKYYEKLHLKNEALRFLPAKLTRKNLQTHLRSFCQPIPEDIMKIIEKI